MSHFVKPEPVRLDLADGEHLIVKRRLNHGEQEDMYASMMTNAPVGDRPLVNSRQARTARVLAYLLGWSLTDDGRPVLYGPDLPVQDRESLLNSLDPETFNEIHQRILEHEAAQDAARGQKKTALRMISPSAG